MPTQVMTSPTVAIAAARAVTRGNIDLPGFLFSEIETTNCVHDPSWLSSDVFPHHVISLLRLHLYCYKSLDNSNSQNDVEKYASAI